MRRTGGPLTHVAVCGRDDLFDAAARFGELREIARSTGGDLRRGREQSKPVAAASQRSHLGTGRNELARDNTAELSCGSGNEHSRFVDRSPATRRVNDVAPVQAVALAPSRQPTRCALLHRDAIKIALSRATIKGVHIRRWTRDDTQRVDSAGAGKAGDVLLRNQSPFWHGR
jgi:hypothetical protein